MTIDDVHDAILVSNILDLKGAGCLAHVPPEKVLEICNGIGPEWFPSCLCAALDKLHPSLKVVSMIHDMEYYFGDGSAEYFYRANMNFKWNGYAVANWNYKWYDPRRYLARDSAVRFYSLCQRYGWSAYVRAMKDREGNEGKNV